MVWRKAVTNPAQAPASMAAGMARKGCPAAVRVTDTGAAQDETAVGGQVGDVQHPVA